MMVTLWIAVTLLGGLGAVARFLVDRAVSGPTTPPFPIGILVVNISGATLLGFLSGLALGPHTALLIGTAFLGSYTTFSTWMFQSQRLAEERRFALALANVGVSVVLGLAGVWLGATLAGLIHTP